MLTGLNLCRETLDGIRNHSWSRPAPGTVEGEIVSWADRIAYCAHDLEDAVHSGIVGRADLPARWSRSAVRPAASSSTPSSGPWYGRWTSTVRSACRPPRRRPGRAAVVQLRADLCPAGLGSPVPRAVIDVLRALVEHYVAQPASSRRCRPRRRKRGRCPGCGDLRGRDDRPLCLRPGCRAGRLGPGPAATHRYVRIGEGPDPHSSGRSREDRACPISGTSRRRRIGRTRAGSVAT